MEHPLVDLNDEQMLRFQQWGFLRLDCLTTDQELAWLSSACTELVKQEIGHDPDTLSQTTGSDHEESLITIVSPDKKVPEFTQTLFLRNAYRVFARLFSVEETRLLTGWRIFLKYPHSGETSWHQDAAYRPPPYLSAGVWLPLDSVTPENGCLHYLPGSHVGGLRPHHLHNDHLVVNEIDSAHAIACPLLAGEAVVHHCCTLHAASPNKSNRSRRALAIVCQVTHQR
jgi:hypothetical protein